jgi:hypothetical protein
MNPDSAPFPLPFGEWQKRLACRGRERENTVNRSPFAWSRPVLAGSILASSAMAATTLSVSLSDSIRPVTHCAGGSLYGITETLPADIAGMVAPHKAHSYRNPALAGTGHQHAIGGAIKVSERLASTGSKVQFLLADVYPNWPYKWVSTADYKSQVTTVINAKIASGRSNYSGYEIWNEPNGTWQTANGDFNTVCWKPIYDLIRSLDPTAKIIGPSYAYYNNSYMTSFLTWAKANNCLPDIICWHQWGSEGFAGAVATYRALETSLGISPREISINEYSSGTHTLEGCPGVSVPFIAKFERYKVESAMISWWFTAYPGRLGSLLTPANTKGGGWYLYKWYGDMGGYMAKTTPPNDKSDGVDAFASVDRSQQVASIVVGGNTLGAVDVKVGGVPAWMGSSVDVKLESAAWTNKDQAVSGTTVVSTTKFTVTNGSFTVPVNIANVYYAYRLTVTPTTPAGVRSSARFGQKTSIYQIYDPRGDRRGVVDVDGYQNLTDAVAHVFPGPGIYLARPAGQAGSAQKVVVAAP